MGLFNRWGHRRFSDLLSLHIDHRLDESQAAILEGHLATCNRCQEELHTLRATVGLLQALPHAVPRRSFAITEQPQVSRAAPTYLWGMRAATATASVALVLVLAGDLLGTFSRDIVPVSEAIPESAERRSEDTEALVAEEDAESAPPSLASEAATPQADPAALPDAALPNVGIETEETLPVTALEILLGSLLALLASLTIFTTWRYRRRNQTA